MADRVEILNPFNSRFDLEAKKDERLWFTEEEFIEIISHCPNLKKINVCLREGGQRVLQAASTLQHLTSLTISYNETFEIVTLPPGFSALQKLEIRNCVATTLDVSQCSTLTTVEISLCEEMHSIVGLERLPQLEKVSLFGCPCIETIQLPTSGHLKEISVSECPNFTRIINLRNQGRLQELYLSRTQISAFESLVQCTQLLTLTTNGCELSLAERVKIGSQLLPECNWTIDWYNPAKSHTLVTRSDNPTADHINFYNVDLRDLPQVKRETKKQLLNFLCFLGKELKFLKLKGLTLNRDWGRDLTDEDIERIVCACPNIEHFELTLADELTDRVFTSLSRLRYLRVLKLGGESIRMFYPRDAYKQLTLLDLSDCCNLIEVTSIGGMMALKELIIGYTPAARDRRFPKTGPEGYQCDGERTATSKEIEMMLSKKLECISLPAYSG